MPTQMMGFHPDGKEKWFDGGRLPAGWFNSLEAAQKEAMPSPEEVKAAQDAIEAKIKADDEAEAQANAVKAQEDADALKAQEDADALAAKESQDKADKEHKEAVDAQAKADKEHQEAVDAQAKADALAKKKEKAKGKTS